VNTHDGTRAAGALRRESFAPRPGCFFVSGEIERVTAYEAGLVGHHTVRDGHTVPDPLILDE
jgi:hypothetical protein